MLSLIVLSALSDQNADWISKVKDPEIRTGVEAAVNLNMLPSADEKAYPGHFYINADGGGYGSDTTWPGLDSWQMAGAYLLIGKSRIVTDYFDFVRASQRKDGNIPFAIFSGETRPGTTYLRGMKWPDDEFSYKPPIRADLPESSQQTRQWVGLFRHWEIESNPLGTLGPICYLLTAKEIYQATKDKGWLKDHLASVEKCAEYLQTQISANGLLSGSGFYTELPPRIGWDGVTQCYGVNGFRDVSQLEEAAGRTQQARKWDDTANQLAKSFGKAFWMGDHFAEYIHPTHGQVDIHGLSDTNWAAIAFSLASTSQTKTLWPKLLADKAFWWGGMPTMPVTKPFSYQPWEDEAVPFETPSKTNDVASMGRCWYLESLACKRMGDAKRLVEAARLVCKAAKDGFWRERYHPQADGSTIPEGSNKYCEYPAVLLRVVLENRKAFLKD